MITAGIELVFGVVIGIYVLGLAVVILRGVCLGLAKLAALGEEK
jgi:hypothetical protein